MIRELKKKGMFAPKGGQSSTAPELPEGRRATLDATDISAVPRTRLATLADMQSGSVVLCVDIPEIKMCRTLKMNPEAKVMDAIRSIIKRQPLERPIEEYGLYLPPDPEQGQEVGAWLPDSETIAKCNIAQGRQVVLARRPPAITINFEDGRTKAVWMDTSLPVSHLVNLILADLTPEQREAEKFDHALYCSTDEGHVRNTFFEANPSTSPPHSNGSALSLDGELALNATWLDNSLPFSRYSELVDNKQPYLLIWKRRPHYIKVKLHSKMGANKSVRFWYDTTVKEALKHLATYLTDDEDLALFSLQESIIQYEARISRLNSDPKVRAGELDGEGFWLDDNATLQQFEFGPEDALNYKLNPRKVAKEKPNYVMVAFLLDDNTAPRKDSVALEQLKANGKRFSYESESTVKDLLQRITQFLSDIMGDSYNKNSDYGLFIPRKKKKNSDENPQLTGVWLEEHTKLSNYLYGKEDKVVFRKRDKEDEAESKFHWLTFHIPSRFLVAEKTCPGKHSTSSAINTTPSFKTAVPATPSFVSACNTFRPKGKPSSPRSNPSFLSLRVNTKKEDTEKTVSVFYKANKTTLARLMKKLSGTVQLIDGCEWYWDPTFYDDKKDQRGSSTGDQESGNTLLGLYLFKQDESQGVWMDRPDAVVSDWCGDKGAVLKIVERRKSRVPAQLPLTEKIIKSSMTSPSLTVLVQGFYVDKEDPMEFSFDFGRDTKAQEILQLVLAQIETARKDAKEKQSKDNDEGKEGKEGEKSGKGTTEPAKEMRDNLSEKLENREDEETKQEETSTTTTPSYHRPKKELDDEELHWWKKEALPTLLDSGGKVKGAGEEWLKYFRLFLSPSNQNFWQAPSSPVEPDSAQLPGKPLAPERLLLSYPLVNQSLVELGIAVKLRIEWNGVVTKLECDCFESVRNIIHGLRERLRRQNPSFNAEQKLGLWFNPLNTNRKSLIRTSSMILIKGFWLEERRQLSYYLAKLRHRAGLSLDLQLRAWHASLELELVDGTTILLPIEYHSTPLRLAMMDALTDSSSSYTIKTKKLKKIVTSLQESNTSLLIYSREKKIPLDLSKTLVENGVLPSEENHLVLLKSNKTPGYTRLKARPRSQMIGTKRPGSLSYIGLRRPVFEKPTPLSSSAGEVDISATSQQQQPQQQQEQQDSTTDTPTSSSPPPTTKTANHHHSVPSSPPESPTRWVEIKSSRENRTRTPESKKRQMMRMSNSPTTPEHHQHGNSQGSNNGNSSGASSPQQNEQNKDQPSPVVVEETTGVSLWEEEKDPQANIMVSREGEALKLVGASLNKLIIKMTSKDEYDHKWVNTFLLTYQSFTTPTILLQKLVERYMVPKSKTDTNEEWEMMVTKIQLRVCNVINQWLETSFEDFNSKLISRLEGFILTFVKKEHPPIGSKLEKTLHKKLSHVKPKGNRVFTQPPPSPKVPSNLYSASLNFFDIDDEEIARQLTLIDHKFYSAIKSKELLSMGWLKPQHSNKCPNVLAMITRFNELSGWVATMIVKVESLNNRVKMYMKMLSIAQKLKDLGNFSGLMAFIAGWNTSPILRMKMTHKELPKKFVELKEDLEASMASAFSYREYRAALHSIEPPCVPYLGVHLQDLVFIDEGNPDTIGENNLINFSKRELVANVILELQQYRQKPYNLTTVSRIASLFAELPHKNTDELYEVSLLREPRQKN